MFVRAATLAAASGLITSIAAAITIPTVSISNPGNAADPLTNFGSVAYTYNIGQTEVTNAQYAAFLNAKAASDPNGLYNTSMAGAFGGITRTGSDGSYQYATVSGRENHPVNFVSFWDATRFANWLHNGQGSGDTEDGAYTLTPDGFFNNTIARNAGWRWAVTSEDEWYKAAYHHPSSQGGPASNYWLYASTNNSISTAEANYDNDIGNTTPFGMYGASYYGTLDQGGNVAEWTESIMFGAFRSYRGGAFSDTGIFTSHLRADVGPFNLPHVEVSSVGFRVSQVPSPGTAAILGAGVLVLRRRRVPRIAVRSDA
jgi:formylglycine-generating enzyme required for sulfatase activity